MARQALKRAGAILLMALALLAGRPGESAAQTGDLPRPSTVIDRGDWHLELGTRAFFSGGRLQKSLYAPARPDRLNSRLTYGSSFARTGEIFGRLDMPAGFFVKGYAGLGQHAGGQLIDEDFPPGYTPYSRTIGEMRNGRIDYVSIDVGRTVWQSEQARLGAFVGFHRFFEKYHAYGCRQTARDTMCVPPTPTSHLDMSETARWTSVRLGIVGDYKATDRLTFSVEAVFLPYAHLDAFDNHWNRPEINPTAEMGHGIGAQFEASASYRLTDHFSTGVGGRAWYAMTSRAKALLSTVTIPVSERFWSERWGGFVQASYRQPF